MTISKDQIQQLRESKNLEGIAAVLEPETLPYLADLASTLMGEQDWYLAGLVLAVVTRKSLRLGVHCTQQMFKEMREQLGE